MRSHPKVFGSVCVAALCLLSCQSYTGSSAQIRSSLIAARFDQALEKLDQSKIATEDRSKALYLMERGQILYLRGDYAEAAKVWREAGEHIDTLYTTSISNTAASLTINQSFSDYEGESHEQVLLPIFSALAWAALGDWNRARIEIRRTDEVLSQIKKREQGGKELYGRDAFPHYLSALIYEANKEWDSAIIEYKRGLDALTANSSWAGQRVRASLIADPLCQLASLRKRTEMVEFAQKFVSGPLACNKPLQKNQRTTAEVVAFYEVGRSPLKVPRDIVIPIQGQVVRISFPVYERQPYASGTASIQVNNIRAGRTEVIQDIGHLARKALEARRGADTVKMAARVLAKDQAARATGRALGPLAGLVASVFGAVTETADTRSWTSLPDQIQVARLKVPANQLVTIRIVPNMGKPVEQSVRLNPGDVHVMRLRTF